jgi:hypothetical protein
VITVDTVLLIITVLSLSAALVSFIAVRRMKHTDQLRSDARVAALVSAADALPAHVEPAVQGPRRAAAMTDGTWSSVAGEWQWKPEAAPRVSPAEIRLNTEAANSDLFGTARREPPPSRRFAFAAALALIVALGGAAIVLTTSRGNAPARAAQASHANPLELVSLGHARDATSLTINGVVRNPANGPKLEGLTAVVSLIDGNGGLISTKDVPLDYRALAPGEEAPFKVTVPNAGAIARYRVSFRAGSDVVPHIDRRNDGKLASAL